MDYAFVPGDLDYFTNGWRTLFDNGGWPDGKRLDDPDLRSLFLDELLNVQKTSRPIGNLIIVGHAIPNGFFKVSTGVLRIGHGISNFTEYEELLEAKRTGELKIPDEVLPSEGTTVHVRGCQIGVDQNLPFLRKFREVLGPKITVTGPKHMDGIQVRRDENGQAIAWIEFMLYSFSVFSSTPLQNAGAVLDAFASRNFILIDNQLARREWLKQFVPKKIPKLGEPQQFNFSVNLDPNWNLGSRETLKNARFFFYDTEEPGNPFPIAISQSPPRDPTSLTIKEKQDFIKANSSAFSDKDEFRNDWPLHKRFGFDTISHFIDGYDWIMTPGDGGVAKWAPRRFSYTMWVPIIDTNNGILFGIFYRQSQPAQIYYLNLNDASFYARVTPP